MNVHSSLRVSHFRSFILAGFAGTCLAALAANIYYVPSAEPYLWTDACWFTDAAGTTSTSVPTAADTPYLSFAGLKNKALTIPAGTAAESYALEMRTAGMTLAIEDGASLTTGHSTVAGKANNTTLHVKSGGTFTCKSIFTLCDSTRANVRLRVDAGGFANFPNNLVHFGNNTAGSAFVENRGDFYFNSRANVGMLTTWKDGAAKSTLKAYFDNRGTLTTRSSGSQVFVVGAAPGVTGHLTNRVDGTAAFSMPLSVGGGTNGTGYAVNDGTMSASRLFVGGDTLSSDRDGIPANFGATGTLHNNADLTVSGTTILGGHKYGNGTLENYGTLSLGGNFTVAERQSTTGRFVAHAGSTTTLGGDCTVSYYGDATFLAEGDAQIAGSGKGLWIANDKGNSRGRVALSGTACFSNVGTVEMGFAGTTQADLELSDAAKLDGTGSLFIGRGATSAVNDAQRARVSLTGQSMITNLNGNIYLATNNYGRAELVVADDAVIDFADVEKARVIEVASKHSGTLAQLTLRGGTIRLPSTNSTIKIGYANYTTAKCNGFLRGWGTITRHRFAEANSYAESVNLVMPCGAIIADGEGEARDLDLSMVRKVNDSSSVGANLSGTNGWYAVDKGRLYYPCRYAGYANLGSYYGDKTAPSFVNGVTFAFAGRADGAQLHGQLYATDRDDIPSGLPEDRVEKGVKRLGVWRAALRGSYRAEEFESSGPKSFTSATATIRYDNFALDALRDVDGNFRSDQRIALYQHRDGGWKKLASLPVDEAESTHRIAGTLLPTADDWNMGFFAVVAEIPHGTVLTLR